MHALVLLSGGLDSLACLLHYRRTKVTVSTLFVDYGQPAADQEFAAVSRLSSALRFPVASASVRGLAVSQGFVRGRNALLLQLGLMRFQENSGVVGIGVHAGTSYSDCSASFIRDTQRLFDLYADGTVQVDAPFLSWSKRDIWEFLLEHHAPVGLTYSCERGGEQPCGNCRSCQDTYVLRSR